MRNTILTKRGDKMSDKKKRRESDEIICHHSKKGKNLYERPISEAYPAIDNDLARDNIENDIPLADLEDI